MTEKLTIREIAEKAGVSIATVSRAINRHTSRFVKKSTRDKILRVVKKTSYLPSPVAKRLATGKSKNIIVFLGTRRNTIFYNDYYMKLLSGLMEVLEDTQYNLIIRMMKRRESRFDFQRALQGMDVAGCIVCDFLDVLRVSLTGIEETNAPAVVLNRSGRKKNVAFIACDNFNAAYKATKHLIDLGHRKIAIVKGDYFEKDLIDRFDGYMSALMESSIPLDPAYVYEGTFSERTGIDAVKAFMDLEDRPTALFCTSDEIAIGAYLKLEEMGLSCPRDLSIIGFDGIDAGRYLIPPLTTMRQPIHEMAQEAARKILRTIEHNEDIGGMKIFDVQLIRGGTCARPLTRAAPQFQPRQLAKTGGTKT